MAEPSIACPSCGKTILLTRALRGEIERELRDEYESRLNDERAKLVKERVRLKQELTRDLAREIEERLADERRLKDAEKERQLAELRRQIEDLKRKADQGSQQRQGEAGEGELESTLRGVFPMDDITGIAQGVRGADLHQVVVDGRGARRGSILWECKNARNWSEGWIAKLKSDQRALHADVAILVTAALPKDCRRFAMIDGVLVTDFACAAALAAVVRANLLELAHARHAAVQQHGPLELLHRYLSGLEFRQRVEAIVEAFTSMRADLEQERRAAERAWARRAKQIEAVTLNVAGFYGDLQGLLPALPAIGPLQLPGADAA